MRHGSDRLLKGQLLHRIGAQLLHRAAHVRNAMLRRITDARKLRTSECGRRVQRHHAGVQPCSDPRQCMSKRIVDFPREAVALTRLRHVCRMDGIGAEALVCLLELLIEQTNACTLLILVPDEQDDVGDKEDRV